MWELVSIRGQTPGNRLHEDPRHVRLPPSAHSGRSPESPRAPTRPAASCPLWGKLTEVSGADPWLALDRLPRGQRPVWMEAGGPSSFLSI